MTEVAVLLAKTKSTDVAEKIVYGDPFANSYGIDDTNTYWAVSGEDSNGVRYWYVALTVFEARTESFPFSYFYCGLKDVIVEKDRVFVGQGSDGDPLTGPYYSTLDAHVPSD